MTRARYPLLAEADWLRWAYIDEGRSTRQIAAEVGCSASSVWRALERHGIPPSQRYHQPAVHPGDRYGRLVVVAEAGRCRHGRRTFFCKCECGGEVWPRAGSCGQATRAPAAAFAATCCAATATPARGTHRSWLAMLARCTNPKATGWDRYGGRGITVAPAWVGPDGFTAFVSDMGERPEGRTLDRFPDNDGNYEPGTVAGPRRASRTATSGG